jgi:hypothetical protein
MRRSPWPVAALALAGLVPGPPAAAAPAPLRHVVALATEIGPRKTGSDADRRAVEYVRAALEEAGLAVELQEVDRVLEADGERIVGSWNVLGRLAGDGAETLIVAAHHDSRGASIPGANDNASGVAVLIETARRVAARPRRLSYLFASFAAEEEGLLGSRHYARGADLSRVRAVVALELVGRGDLLVGPVPGPPPLWAQRALRRAARGAGVRGVVARPLWTLGPRLLDLPYAADHEPFLERGVPAFLIAGTYEGWTYHTPEDAAGIVRGRSLERAVAVLDRLLLDLEAAPPQVAADPHYLPLTLFGRALLVPSAVLWWVGAAALAWTAILALGRIGALMSPRRILEVIRVLVVTAAATALGLSGLFAGEALLERVHGVRHPWMAHHGLHLALAAAGAAGTGWLGLKLFRRIKPTIDPEPYGAAALLIPAAATAATLWRGWPEIACFAAAPLLAFLLSRLTGRIGRKLACGLAGLLPLAALATPADYRALVDLGGFEASLPLLFAATAAAALPFVLHLAHVAAFRDCLHSRIWRRLAGRGVGVAALAVWAALAVAAALLPAYDTRHRQVVRVRQSLDLDARRAGATLLSNDTLRGVSLRGGAGGALDGRRRVVDLPFPAGAPVLETAVARHPADPRRVICAVRLATGRPTDRVAYTFTSRAGFAVPERGAEPRRAYTVTVVAPRTDPEAEFVLDLPESGDLDLAVRAEFDADLLGLDPRGGARVFVHRAAVTATRVLLPAAPGPAVPPPPG